MPAPTFSPGTYGGLLQNISVSPQTTVAVFVSTATIVASSITCELQTGATAPTAPTTFALREIYAQGSPQLTVGNGGIAAGGTSLPVSSALGLHQNQQVLIISSALTYGEIVTITSAPSGTAAQTLTCSPVTYPYAAGDNIYLMALATSANQISPSSPNTQTWSTDSNYSATLHPEPAQYALVANNTDTAATVIVSASINETPAIQ